MKTTLKEHLKSFFTAPRIIMMCLVGAAMALDTLFASATTFTLAMAALAEDRDTPMRDNRMYSYPVKAATKIYAGSMVAIDADGYAVPAADTAGLALVGRAEEQIDNSSGSSGDLSVLVRRGTFKWAATGMTIANVGDPVFVLDDQTVGVASGATNEIFAGTIVEVESATAVWVESDASLALYGKTAATVAAVATANADDTYGTAEATLINELKTQVNAILTALKAAGVMKT